MKMHLNIFVSSGASSLRWNHRKIWNDEAPEETKMFSNMASCYT